MRRQNYPLFRRKIGGDSGSACTKLNLDLITGLTEELACKFLLNLVGLPLSVMGRLLPILLIACFIFDAFGYYFIYQNRILMAKRQANAIINSATSEKILDTVVIPKNEMKEVEWLSGNEFRYHGEMYDVVNRIESDDHLVYTCYHDVKEGNTVKSLARQVNRKSSSGSNRTARTLKEFNNYFTENTLSYKILPSICICYDCSSHLRVSLFDIPISSPPPQLA